MAQKTGLWGYLDGCSMQLDLTKSTLIYSLSLWTWTSLPSSFCLLGPVQVLLRSGSGVFELWLTLLYPPETLQTTAAHVCFVLSVCAASLPAARDTHLHTWRSSGFRWEKVAELYSVKYCQYRPRKPAGVQWVYFFSSGEMPPLWIPPPLCVFLSQPPVVPWLLPWSSLDDEHRLLNGMRFTVHNALCSFNSLISIFCSALYYKSLNAGAQSLNVTKCPV